MNKSDQSWYSDGFELSCYDGEKLRVTFALDCCNRKAIDWAASTGGYNKAAVQDVMSSAIEKRFGDKRAEQAIQKLTDNASGCTSHETRQFSRKMNLESCTTAVSSPKGNGMAERFVKTLKEDYIAFMSKPDVSMVLHNLAVAFEHYNENNCACGYLSPREYRRPRATLTPGCCGSRIRPPELIQQAFTITDTVTRRKRKLPPRSLWSGW